VPSQAGHRCSPGFETRVFIPTLHARHGWLGRQNTGTRSLCCKYFLCREPYISVIIVGIIDPSSAIIDD
jgi:hypothetical protein